MPNYSPRRVYFAAQETTGDWEPTDTNSAGSMDLTTEGVLLATLPFRRQTLIWSTVDLWAMVYTGGDFKYSFDQVGMNCGIISRNAAVVVDSGAYWMGQGKFFFYDGYVKPLPCDVSDKVFQDFNAALADEVWAYANPLFNEITWHYASAGSNVLDRYVSYNYVENHWTYGALSRAAGVTFQAKVGNTPVLIDADGNIFDHETGDARTGMTVFLESGPMQIGEGDRVVHATRIVPDDKTLGDVSATLFASDYPDDVEESESVSLASPTDVRITGRQFRLRLQEAVATAWRVGVVRIAGVLGGMR